LFFNFSLISLLHHAKPKTLETENSLPQIPWICNRTNSIVSCSSSTHAKPLKLNTPRTLSMLMSVSNFSLFFSFFFNLSYFFQFFLPNYERFQLSYHVSNHDFFDWFCVYGWVVIFWFCVCGWIVVWLILYRYGWDFVYIFLNYFWCIWMSLLYWKFCV